VKKAKPQLTKAGEPRKRAPGAGRPALGKVKLTVHILPATRAALGSTPGAVLDAHFGDSNDSSAGTGAQAQLQRRQ
jgi:hypothetical protein